MTGSAQTRRTADPVAARADHAVAFRPVAAILWAFALLHTAPAAAQDYSQTRILPENSFLTRNKDGVPYFYGQLNKAFLFHDDGDETNIYPLVDNANSGSRGGIVYEEMWWPNVTVFANVEASWNTYTSTSVSQTDHNRFNVDAGTLRKAEVSFEVEGYGRLWIGQGSTASDGTSEYDLSGTTVAAYSSVTDIAGGQFYAFGSAPGLSPISIGTTMRNFDGLGRLMRVRYDTPRFHGIRVSSSVGYDALNGLEDVQWDIAATYSRDRDGENFALAAGAAFSIPDLGQSRANGSFSVLHKPTGLSLTLAGGHDERENSNRTPQFAYVKLGYAPKLTTLGPTSFSIDAYAGEDFLTLEAESFSIGLAAVQRVDFKDSIFDIYGVVRLYSYDDTISDYDDGLSVMTGVRWRF